MVYSKSVENVITLGKMIGHVVTPHAQRERDKVIDRGVHIYIIYIMFVDEKNI